MNTGLSTCPSNTSVALACGPDIWCVVISSRKEMIGWLESARKVPMSS